MDAVTALAIVVAVGCFVLSGRIRRRAYERSRTRERPEREGREADAGS